ncbi:MAG: tRNA lysidine(34) synthetase TilS [Thermodesulfobacteriota bacterium]|nr:tRNA lysidine(34) synthetase TilS [Thermodesulfobacteriota bacterium]
MKFHPIEKKVLSTILDHKMITKGDKIIVAVSGGADSVCLLKILYQLHKSLDFTIIVAHFDHGLRPEEDKEETKFVYDLAKKLNVTFVYDRPKKAINTNGSSIEERAREERYQFLKRVLDKHNGQKVALGHNMNDQAETVLTHFLRGSGITGLSGMPAIRDEHYIRPLMFVRGDEIRAYLNQNHTSFMTDSSNFDKRYLRNRLRLELIPLLLSYQPRLIQHLSDSAGLFRHEDQFLEKEAQEAMKIMSLDSREKSLELSLPLLKIAPPALKYRIIRKAIKEVNGNLRRIDLGHIKRIAGLIDNSKPQIKINLPEGLVVKKIYERLKFNLDDDTYLESFSYSLKNIGKFYIHETDQTIILKEISKKDFSPYAASPFLAFLDLDTLQWPLKIRNFREGDKFIPLGLNGFKKVKNIFIDNKIPIEDRKKTIILENHNDIIWIPGIRIDERYKIKEHTKRILKCAIE